VRLNNDGLIAAYRNLTDRGVMIITVVLDVPLTSTHNGTHIFGPADNAVNPARRDTIIDTVLTTPLNLSDPVPEWDDFSGR
jgi:hypothetical protein